MKPTDKNTTLMYSSHHPRNMVRALPYSQMLRAKRIVSTDEELEKSLTMMTARFRERGYPRKLLKMHRERVTKLDRTRALEGSRQEKHMSRIPFISTYTEKSKEIGNIIKHHWPILTKSLGGIPEFSNPPLLSYRRARNLKDQLIKADIGPKKTYMQSTFGQPSTGCFPCLGCVNCRYICKSKEFTHPGTKVSFPIKFHLRPLSHLRYEDPACTSVAVCTNCLRKALV